MGLRRMIFGLTCREVSDFLLAWLEGDLPEAERAAFRRHLFWCRDCVNYVDNYRETVRLAQSLGEAGPEELPEPIPDDLLRAVLAAKRANG